MNWFVTESPRPAWIARRSGARWLVIATVCFGAFMGQFDASIVTMAFPAMSEHFGRDPEWISISYLITLVALLVPMGRIADRVGRKIVYIYGFALFTAASVACVYAPSFDTLIAARVGQAIGAAMLQANSVALVTTNVEPEKRRKALGIQAAAQAIGLAAGPLLGGYLVEHHGWQVGVRDQRPDRRRGHDRGPLPAAAHRKPREARESGRVGRSCLAWPECCSPTPCCSRR